MITKTFSANGISTIRANVTPNVANVALFLFSIAMTLRIFTSAILNTKVKNEEEKMLKFGLDLENLLELIGYYESKDTSTLPKEEAGLIAYHLIMYHVANGDNAIKWIAGLVPAPFKSSFNFTTASLDMTVFEQLVIQKSSVSNILKSSTAKSSISDFMLMTSDWVNKIGERYLDLVEKLGISKFAPVQFKEFIGCLIQDSYNLNRIEIADAAIKNKSFLAEEANCPEAVIETWAAEFRKPVKNFKGNHDSTINTVTSCWQMEGITPPLILAIDKFNKSLLAANAN